VNGPKNITGKIKKHVMKNNDNEIKEITKIYLVTNCYGDSNKVYIGKEKLPQNGSRKNCHIKTYGKQIIFEYIDEIKGWDRQDWEPLECKWIQHYIDLGYEVLNKNKGGGGCQFATEEMKLKISNKNKGKEGYWRTHDRSEESKQNMRVPKNHGEKISILKKGKPKPEGFGELISKIKSNNSRKGLKRERSVNQYDLENNFIKTWKSIAEAEKAFKICGVGHVCRNKIYTAGGYIWKFKD